VRTQRKGYIKFTIIAVNIASRMTNNFITNYFDFGLTGHYQVANQLETLLMNTQIIFFSYLIEIQIQFSIGLHCIQINSMIKS
jgi:hypothetical protein